jgi:hypothetical protein
MIGSGPAYLRTIAQGANAVIETERRGQRESNKSSGDDLLMPRIMHARNFQSDHSFALLQGFLGDPSFEQNFQGSTPI